MLTGPWCGVWDGGGGYGGGYGGFDCGFNDSLDRWDWVGDNVEVVWWWEGGRWDWEGRVGWKFEGERGGQWRLVVVGKKDVKIFCGVF